MSSWRDLWMNKKKNNIWICGVGGVCEWLRKIWLCEVLWINKKSFDHVVFVIDYSIIYYKKTGMFNFHYGGWCCSGVMPLKIGKSSHCLCLAETIMNKMWIQMSERMHIWNIVFLQVNLYCWNRTLRICSLTFWFLIAFQCNWPLRYDWNIVEN
jgi:hypothetical protein